MTAGTCYLSSEKGEESTVEEQIVKLKVESYVHDNLGGAWWVMK